MHVKSHKFISCVKNVPLCTSKLENVPKVTDKIAISISGHVSLMNSDAASRI